MEIALKVLKVVPGLKRAVEYFAQKRFNTNVGAPALGHMLIPKGSAENINIYIAPKGGGGIGNAHIENLETNISLSFANVTIESVTGTSLILGGRTSAQITNSECSAIISTDTGSITESTGSILLGTSESAIDDSQNTVVLGGYGHTVSGKDYSAIVAGSSNNLNNGGSRNVILGGINNNAYGTNGVIFGDSGSDRGTRSSLAQGYFDEIIQCNAIRFWYSSGVGWVDSNINPTYIAPEGNFPSTKFYLAQTGTSTLASQKLRIHIYDNVGGVAYVEQTVVYSYDIGTGTITILAQTSNTVYSSLVVGWALTMAVNAGHLCISFTAVSPYLYRIRAYAELFDMGTPEPV